MRLPCNRPHLIPQCPILVFFFQFTTPGDAETLELMSPLFIGGLDANIESLFLPPVLWTAGFRQGFVGCLRDLVINGHSVDLAEFAKVQDSGSIRPSCHIMPPKW